MKKNQPPCPECEKLSSVAEQSNKLGDFLDWLKEEYYICEYESGHGNDYIPGYYPIRKPIEQILAKYFDIDLDKVDAERMELLKWIQEKNNHGI